MFRPKKLSDDLYTMSSQFNIFVISFYVVDFVRDKLKARLCVKTQELFRP